MLYNKLIEEVTKRVESVNSISDKYPMSFSEKLAIWLEDFEHDILLSKGSKEVLSEEYLANAAFDKMLDEELMVEAITPPNKKSADVFYKCTWVD